MTEGPEATFLAEMIYQHFRGKRLMGVKIRKGRYKTHGPGRGFSAFQRMLPLRLTDVYKKGKVLFLLFEDNWTLIAKMGMTGWFYRDREETRGRPLFHSPPHVTFAFENENLQFADFRNFGTLTFTDKVLDVMEEMDRLAPDVLNPYTTFDEIAERVEEAKESPSHRTMTIADALMDQTLLLSGIGNILKSELLYEAGVSPRRELKDIREREWRAIVSAAKTVSKRTLAVLEAREGEGREDYVRIRRVYGKEVDPDGRRVTSYQTADGRATYYVPAVQA